MREAMSDTGEENQDVEPEPNLRYEDLSDAEDGSVLNLSTAEMREILKDPEHPLYADAKAAEERLAKVFEPIFKRYRDALAPQFKMPTIDTPTIATMTTFRDVHERLSRQITAALTLPKIELPDLGTNLIAKRLAGMAAVSIDMPAIDWGEHVRSAFSESTVQSLSQSFDRPDLVQEVAETGRKMAEDLTATQWEDLAVSAQPIVDEARRQQEVAASAPLPVGRHPSEAVAFWILAAMGEWALDLVTPEVDDLMRLLALLIQLL